MMNLIDNYSFGRIVVNGKVYDSDIIIFPEYIKRNWWRIEGHKLHVDDIRDVLKYKPDILIVGTGAYGMLKILEDTAKKIREEGIKLIALPTEEACKEYNKLVKKGYKVVAALHLTC